MPSKLKNKTPMQLTEEQIKAEAENRYPSTHIFNGMRFDDHNYLRKREAYIAGATSEREKVKPLLEALVWIKKNYLLILNTNEYQNDCLEKINDCISHYSI